MRYTQIRAFHEVALEKSVSKAAQKMGQTQPALSTQLRNLEKEYGVKLFERTTQGLTLTQQGEKLLELTHGFLKQETYIDDFLKSSGALLGGTIRLVGDDPVTALNIITPFKAAFDNVEITMDFGNTLQACQSLKEHKVDIAVITDLGTTDIQDENFMRLPLWRHGLSVVVPNGHELTKHKNVCTKDLVGYSYINREHGSLTRRAFTRLFQENDVTLESTLSLCGREAIREAVAQGNGIGFISDHEKGHDSRLTTLPLSDARQIFQTSLVYLASQKERPIIAEFINTAKQCKEKGSFEKPPSSNQK
ncbi:LysR substrate-binding domain-containing protein [Terasakiella pusilla]|uniref:LysR substrate-binding domain-containing protein n=1 Tax=Terasakiella pusilla TaxID=64973 RepID=UPI003AA7F131